MSDQNVVGTGIRPRRLLVEGYRQQRALYLLTDRLYRARSLAEAYDATLETMSELLGCDRVSILRFDKRGVMRFVASKGLSPEYREAVTGHSPWCQGDRDPEPIFVADIEDMESEDLKQVIRAEGIRALAFVPLTVNRTAVGKFMVYHEAPHTFTAEERELALIVARQLSFCIELQDANMAASRLRALIESSDDAIIANDLEGVIQGWNRGAEKLFGYRTEEVIDRPITLLIPEDRLAEETAILDRIRQGGHVENYATIRRRKDGSLVHVSLTISPIVDQSGRILGVSKIARDITGQHLAQERQQLLLREMNHRVKNLFAVTTSIINLNARTSPSAKALADSVIQRLTALGRAHALTMANVDLEQEQTVMAQDLAWAILGPHDDETNRRISISGADFLVDPKAVTPLALLLHEFATNASKYGSLANGAGRVELDFSVTDDMVRLLWREIGGSPAAADHEPGFGTRLVKATAAQLHGGVSRSWDGNGLLIDVYLSKQAMLAAPR
jgi:PAS domain S-box-containing protein